MELCLATLQIFLVSIYLALSTLAIYFTIAPSLLPFKTPLSCLDFIASVEPLFIPLTSQQTMRHPRRPSLFFVFLFFCFCRFCHHFPGGYQFEFSSISSVFPESSQNKSSNWLFPRERRNGWIVFWALGPTLALCLGSGSTTDILFPSSSVCRTDKYSHYKCSE